MAKDDLKPTTIPEIPFPGIDQTVSSGASSGKDDLIPTEISAKTFPVTNIATGLRSTSLDTETRTINSNFSFQRFGAISIGNLSYGTPITGTGIRISPNGIYGYSAGVTTFSLNAITGAFVTSGYIQVGGAASDVNGGITLISAGKVLISGSTALSAWSSGSDATFIDGGKLYTGTVTASKISVTNLAAINADIGSITAGTLTGVTFKTSTNNERIEITGDLIKFYVGNVLKAQLDGSAHGAGGVKNTGDFFVANNRSYWITSSAGGSTQYGGIGITSGNQFWLTLGTDNTFYMKNNAQNDNYFTVSNDRAYHRAEFKADLGAFTNINNTTLNGNAIWYWSLNYYSDKSIKKDIVAKENNLIDILKLNPVEFAYADDPTNQKHFGFLAQDLETIYPNLVNTNSSGVKGADITQLIPLLIGAVKELKSELEVIKTKLKP